MTRSVVPELEAPDAALEARLGRRLAEVEEMLEHSVSSDIGLVSEAARHLLSAGGKRLRPMLVLLGGHFGDPEEPRLVPGAVAIELTHAASLYHDDVIDEAEFRRGNVSANARWDNTVAVLSGDYLFARASEISAELGTEVSRLLAATIAKVCEGQILEAEATGRVDITEDAYADIIRRKTASLIATSGRLGGMLGGASAGVVDGLTRYGEAVGVAFQLSDDIMDVTADEATLGKEPAADLREGVYTLPVIFALRDGDAGAELRGLLSQGPPEGDRLARVLELIRTDGALGRAREAVTHEVRRALAGAATLPEGHPREALEHLATFVATRCGAQA